MLDSMFTFGGKPDDHAGVIRLDALRPHVHENIGILRQVDSQPGVAAGFLDFLLGDGVRAKIRDSRRHNQRVGCRSVGDYRVTHLHG